MHLATGSRLDSFETRKVMKKTENCLLYNLESQLWAIGCVEIFSSIWMAYYFTLCLPILYTLIIHN
jgi:hypothetical protein